MIEYFRFNYMEYPKTLNYMVVLNEVKLGNLIDNLMIKKCNPNDKYGNFILLSINVIYFTVIFIVVTCYYLLICTLI